VQRDVVIVKRIEGEGKRILSGVHKSRKGDVVRIERKGRRRERGRYQ